MPSGRCRRSDVAARCVPAPGRMRTGARCANRASRAPLDMGSIVFFRSLGCAKFNLTHWVRNCDLDFENPRNNPMYRKLTGRSLGERTSAPVGVPLSSGLIHDVKDRPAEARRLSGRKLENILRTIGPEVNPVLCGSAADGECAGGEGQRETSRHWPQLPQRGGGATRSVDSIALHLSERLRFAGGLTNSR